MTPGFARRAMPAALLFAVALAVRLLYLHQLSGTPLGTWLLGDGAAYDAWARRIAAGDWWGDEVFYQAPLYPYFLGALYALFGPGAAVARVAQCVLGAAGCVLVAAAGARYFGRAAGAAAGVLLAFYAPAIFYDGEIQKDTLSLPFMGALLLALAALRERPAARLALAAGALAGLFALNRENALVLPPLLAVWLLAGSAAPRRARIAASGCLLAGAAAVLLPVALRNRALGGELLPTTSQAGANFYIGNHAGADGRYHPLRPGRGSARYEREDATALAEAAAGRELSPAEVSRYWFGEALRFARERPFEWLRLLARKWRLVWHRREIVDTTSVEAAADVSWLLAGLGRVLHFGVLAPLAAAGIWLTRRRWRELSALYLLLAGFAAAVAAFFVFGRYRYPLVAPLALFAGAALAELAGAARRRSAAGLAPALACALAAGVWVNWPLDGRDPRAVTWASLGRAMEEAGRVEEAAQMLERAVRLSPGFAEAALALGDLRLAAGELEAAEASYRRVLELEPGRAEAWNNLGVVSARRGRPDEALAQFRRAVAADPRHAPSRFNLGRTLAATGDPAGAREQFAALVGIAPDDAGARIELANLLAFGGDLAAARAHYERAIALAPGRADARFKLWAVADGLGDPAFAREQLRAALALEPAYAERLLALAGEHERAGRADVAARQYRQLLALVPGHAEAARRLARLEDAAAKR